MDNIRSATNIPIRVARVRLLLVLLGTILQSILNLLRIALVMLKLIPKARSPMH